MYTKSEIIIIYKIDFCNWYLHTNEYTFHWIRQIKYTSKIVYNIIYFAIYSVVYYQFYKIVLTLQPCNDKNLEEYIIIDTIFLTYAEENLKF